MSQPSAPNFSLTSLLQWRWHYALGLSVLAISAVLQVAGFTTFL